MSCRRRNGRLDDKERGAQKLGVGLGFASVRKSTAVMRDFTHHRGGVFADVARIVRVSAVLLETLDAEFPALRAATTVFFRQA